MNSSVLVYKLQPLEDPRWITFVERHPRASVFHSSHWLEALRRTYGYDPIVYTTSAPGVPIENGVVFCRVNSWLTGQRLVSVPFSDYCDILIDDQTDRMAVFSVLSQALKKEHLDYVEMRSRSAFERGQARPTRTYFTHQLDLQPDIATLFRRCHKSSIQRKIHRAAREGLNYKQGHTEALLEAFYGLLLLTRRRHHLPPQPKRWFKNLIDCFGDSLQIRVAFKDATPVAAIVTLRHKDILLYKYGCSDAFFHRLGGNHLLLWRAIEEAKEAGLRAFEFGRSDCEQTGLIVFKDRWGAVRAPVTYLTMSAALSKKSYRPFKEAVGLRKCVTFLVPHLSDYFLSALGDLLYKHAA